MKKLSILVVDDEKGYRDEISEYLIDCGFNVLKAEKPSQALEILYSDSIDIAIVDLKLPEMDGITLLKKMLEFDPEIAVILISGHGDMESVIKAMREGALDFFAKPFDLIDIQYSIERTQKYLTLHEQISEIRRTYEKLLSSQDAGKRYQIIGKSESMKNILHLMKHVADTKNTDVLITGESGTGKELVARGIHNLSERKDKPFMPVDCGAIPESLFESELFGHTQGAFTGASDQKKGKFELAHGGTLFLDEINNLPLNLQPKFLRAIQEKEIQRLGDEKSTKVDVRIIVASNNDIYEDVKKGAMREDLFYRIHEFKIDLPTLKERKDDILTIAQYFLDEINTAYHKNITGFTQSATKLLENYSWPGNIRELKSVIKSAVLLTDSSMIDSDHLVLKDVRREESNQQLGNTKDEDGLLLDKFTDRTEEDIIKKALIKAKYNKTKAAELLGISRSQFYKKLEKYGL